MGFRNDDLGVLSAIVFLITLWLLMARGSMRAENNWPLVYFFGMMIYLKRGGTFLEPGFVYAGVIFTLLLRFEFLSPKFVRFFRVAEACCLCYFLWKTLQFSMRL